MEEAQERQTHGCSLSPQVQDRQQRDPKVDEDGYDVMRRQRACADEGQDQERAAGVAPADVPPSDFREVGGIAETGAFGAQGAARPDGRLIDETELIPDAEGLREEGQRDGDIGQTGNQDRCSAAPGGDTVRSVDAGTCGDAGP